MLTRCSIAVLRFVNEIVLDGSAMKDFSQTDPLPNSALARKAPPDSKCNGINSRLLKINPFELADSFYHHGDGLCQIR
jgi:hypothetical protein